MASYIYSKEDLRAILFEIVRTGSRWEHYDHTVKIADFWTKIITGKNHDDILLSLRIGEGSEMKKQRVRLYNSRTKYVASKVAKQIQEVYRSDNIYSEIYYTDKKEGDLDRIKKLQEKLKSFVGKKSVREWLRSRYLRLNMVDPNAFIVVNFKDDGTCYPIEVPSRNVLSRQHVNGVLQYFSFIEDHRMKVEVDGKIKTEKAYKYWMFGYNEAILLHKVPQGGVGIGQPIELPSENESKYEDSKFTWYYSDYVIKAEQVPAFCVGYVPDPENNDQTFQSILYPAEELFKELIWKKNTYDLHMTLHGIAKQYVFVPECEHHDKGQACKGGKIGDRECPACRGTGQMPFHTSEQDVITVTMPRNRSEIWDLSKMIYYQKIPSEVIELTRQGIAETEKAISLALFNVSIIDKGELLKTSTATEIRSNTNAVNNVLYEFGLNDAEMYRTIVREIAVYSNLDRSDLVIDYAYPSDFNLESLSDLFDNLKEAISTNSPSIVKRKITSKIIAKLCIGEKQVIESYETREQWRPFASDSQALAAPEMDPSRILWLYFDQIFRELESKDYSNSDVDDPISFAMLPRDKQKELIDAEVARHMEIYKQAKAAQPAITVPRLS